MTDIAANLERVRRLVSASAERSGRSEDEVQILAVSKTFPVEAIEAALAAGHLRFGENRVQEAEPKILSLRGRKGIEWHLIGHLQSNKARKAAGLFDMIHSVDSLKLARKLDQACLEAGKVLPVLVQVDLGHEPTKFGAEQGRIPELVSGIVELRGLKLEGLMTIPPYFEDPEQTRPFFAALRRLRDSLEEERPGCLGRRHLSMGMSHDFEIAIQEGATIVRIGTSIFGGRDYS